MSILERHLAHYAKTEAVFRIVGWLPVKDGDVVIIQTFNGKRRLNWQFNLLSELDRKMLRKALGIPENVPILAGLNGIVDKQIFTPEAYYKPWYGDLG